MKKTIVSFLVSSVITSAALVGTASAQELTAGELKEINFDNVYQFEANSYNRIASYKNLSLSFKDNNHVDLILQTDKEKIELKDVSYTKKVSQSDTSSNLTVIRGKASISHDEHITFDMVYDEIENANGNITITKKDVATQNDGNQKISFKDTNIRFVKGIDSAKEIVQAIDTKAKTLNSLNITPMSSVDYPQPINYKYGSKFYIGYFQNYTYLKGNGGKNPFQIKLKPLGALYSYTDSSGATGKLKEDISGITKFLFRHERKSGVGMLTTPIVNTSPANTLDIGLSYSFPWGVGLGATIKVPLTGSNSAQYGNLARWDMNNIYLDMENNGNSADAFYMYGDIAGNGSGSTTFSSGASATLSGVYVFGNKPAAIVDISEDLPMPDKTITVNP
ncbi:hypothetical protein [Paenibacillus chitinolyticus]|uniref:hypothetical protein n=1 Tax=Paenibacillus chitinolyticus TaxID=79263 RepID=UPI003CFE1381